MFFTQSFEETAGGGSFTRGVMYRPTGGGGGSQPSRLAVWMVLRKFPLGSPLEARIFFVGQRPPANACRRYSVCVFFLKKRSPDVRHLQVFGILLVLPWCVWVFSSPFRWGFYLCLVRCGCESLGLSNLKGPTERVSCTH